MDNEMQTNGNWNIGFELTDKQSLMLSKMAYIDFKFPPKDTLDTYKNSTLGEIIDSVFEDDSYIWMERAGLSAGEGTVRDH